MIRPHYRDIGYDTTYSAITSDKSLENFADGLPCLNYLTCDLSVPVDRKSRTIYQSISQSINRICRIGAISLANYV